MLYLIILNVFMNLGESQAPKMTIFLNYISSVTFPCNRKLYSGIIMLLYNVYSAVTSKC